jgi:hypothetical protein
MRGRRPRRGSFRGWPAVCTNETEANETEANETEANETEANETEANEGGPER